MPAFAAERRRLLHGAAAAAAGRPAVQQSIDISCAPGAQQQTHRTPLLRSTNGTDRRTDGRSTVS